MTVGEVMLRLTIALSGLGYWGAYAAGIVSALAVVAVYAEVRAVRWERREERALNARRGVGELPTAALPPRAEYGADVDEHLFGWDEGYEREFDSIGVSPCRDETVAFEPGVARVGER